MGEELTTMEALNRVFQAARLAPLNGAQHDAVLAAAKKVERFIKESEGAVRKPDSLEKVADQ